MVSQLQLGLMFFQYFTDIPIGLGAVEARIVDLRSKLEHWADVAYRDGEKLYARVGPESLPYPKKVRLELGAAEIRRVGVVYPVSWRATGAEWLFPELTADLILSHLGTERTRLTLQGTYRPPLGVIGRVVDRALLSRVAESTIQDSLDRVALAVSSPDPVG